MQCWHKCYRSKQPLSDWIYGLLHKRAQLLGTKSVTSQVSHFIEEHTPFTVLIGNNIKLTSKLHNMLKDSAFLKLLPITICIEIKINKVSYILLETGKSSVLNELCILHVLLPPTIQDYCGKKKKRF